MTAGTILSLLFFLLFFAVVVVWFAGAAWVIREVRQNEDPRALAWTVSAPVLGVFGPILYIVTTNSPRSAAYGNQTE